MTGTYIIQSTGNLVLGTVKSNGPVFLEAATGSIINGLSNGGLTPQQETVLQSEWVTLNLEGTCTQNCPVSALVSYQNMIDATYNNYAQLLDLAFVNGSYSIGQTGITVFGQQLIANGTLQANTNLTVGPTALTSPTPATLAAIKTFVMKEYEQDEYLLGTKTLAQIETLDPTLEQTVQQYNSQIPATAPQLTPLDVLFGTAVGQTNEFPPAPSTPALAAALASLTSNSATPCSPCILNYAVPTGSQLYSDLTSSGTWNSRAAHLHHQLQRQPGQRRGAALDLDPAAERLRQAGSAVCAERFDR